MSDYRIAIRYAKSLLGLAVERDKLEEVKNDFSDFKNLCQSNRDFVNFLKNPIIPHLKKWGILKKIFKDKVSTETIAFIEIVTRKNREEILPEIAHVFLDLYKDYKGIIDAKILTATPLDPKLKDEMLKIIKKIVGEEKKIEVKEEIEEELIGGFKIVIGDNLLDGSISSQLRELRQKLVV
jgi:F-type H+-transporting ATPase subunit delta